MKSVMFSRVSDLWDSLRSITNPYEGEIEDNTINEDWNWIKDPVIELYQRRALTQITEEVEKLKKDGKRIKSRNVIRAKCQSLIYSLTHEERLILEHTKLPCDTLGSLVRTFVKNVSKQWQLYLITEFPKNAVFFTEAWSEEKYEKNTSGHLVALATCAANVVSVEGMTERQLCDIMWSLRIALKAIITIEINRELNQFEMQKLTDQVVEVIDVYLKLHLETATLVQSSMDKVGLLPEKWREEVVVEEARIEELKKNDQIDHAFKEGPIDPFNKDTIYVDTNEFNKRKDIISDMLQTRINPKKSEPIIVERDEQSIDFQNARTKLEKLFK